MCAVECRAQGRHTDALVAYEEALDIRRECLGVGHPEVAGSMSNVANVLRWVGMMCCSGWM